MYPIQLKPIYDKTIWANDKLTSLRHIEEKGYGTCWEISAHSYCTNEVINGIYKGKTLMELIQEKPKEMLGEVPFEKMLRLAYLDAKEDLSIQVHPHNSYALEHENDLGKTESWYVLDAKPGATLVAGTTTRDKSIIQKAVEEENLEPYLRKVDIEAGDFILIPAGMLHALGAGIFAIEIGTNSNTTYRFYDYNRVDAKGNKRELHLKKSFDVADFSLQSQKISNPYMEGQHKILVDCDEFVVELYDIKDTLTLDTEDKRFHTLSFVQNDAKILYGQNEIDVKYTENVFIPASLGQYTIKGNGRVLVAYSKL
ncbi:type I phosphomannose isomerase catalytic subunit [uncultured Faecalicoccus sp.]|uniref:type I phosphomannose isomerase catalytic subunit n=1 Tax=uncultured Faecalicoccus sp. TaxID=1971760 RepID=UPI002590D082|nr:type I phosphomannose isomerase catalytic subunit [uncultured Faecalicoccus sp.]